MLGLFSLTAPIRGLLKCLGGGRPTTSRHSAISAAREASANPSKFNLMLYSVPISRTEQSPTLFGHTYTGLRGTGSPVERATD